MELISLFAAFLTARDLEFGTIDGYLHAVQAFFMDQTFGAVNPLHHYLVRQTLAGIKQQIGHRPKPKFAILPEFLLAIHAKLSNSPTDIRDWALILVSFWGLLQKSEVIALVWNYIRSMPGGARIFIADGKKDLNHAGMWTTLAVRSDALCPVQALTNLANSLPPELRQPSSFIALSTRQRKWSATQLAASTFVGRIKFWISAIGLDPSNYSGHSLQRGGATAMAAAGVPPDIIQIQGRWRSDAYKLYQQLGPRTLLQASSIPV